MHQCYNESPPRCPEIWDALRVAAESDLALAQTIVDSAGIIVSNPDMTLCYDERGEQELAPPPTTTTHTHTFSRLCLPSCCARPMSKTEDSKYELPKYVLSEPANLIRDG